MIGDSHSNGEASGQRTRDLESGYPAGTCPFWGLQELVQSLCLSPGWPREWEAISSGRRKLGAHAEFPAQSQASGWPSTCWPCLQPGLPFWPSLPRGIPEQGPFQSLMKWASGLRLPLDTGATLIDAGGKGHPGWVSAQPGCGTVFPRRASPLPAWGPEGLQ